MKSSSSNHPGNNSLRTTRRYLLLGHFGYEYADAEDALVLISIGDITWSTLDSIVPKVGSKETRDTV